MSSEILHQDFYVYLHRKATNREVFYVGKGTGRRAWKRSGDGRSLHWQNVARKHGLIVEIAADGLQEWYAHELERDLIALYGRRDLGLGPLVNLTDGGDGVSGMRHGKESIQRISQYLRGRTPSLETRDLLSRVLKGRSFTDAHRAKLSKSHTGMIKPWVHGEKNPAKRPEVRLANSARFTGVPNLKIRGENHHKSKPIFCVELNLRFESASCAARWLVSKGKPKASKSAISRVAAGIKKTAYGYTWRFAA